MQAAIIGLGSIGKRHLSNLERLGFACGDIRVARTRRGTASFGDAVLAEHGGRHPVFEDAGQALAGADIAIIANPTSFHVESALAAVRHGASVLIEKPLDADFYGVDLLLKEANRHDATVCVGYNLRFHPLASRMKQALEAGRIGRIERVETWMSEPVTAWHPWEDHRVSYACRKELGGGVILTQSHEVDLLHFFFGAPSAVKSSVSTDPSLPMDVANVAESTLYYDGFEARHVASYLGPKERYIRIQGTRGMLYWNYYAGTLTHTSETSAEALREPQGFDLNDTFLDELRAFLAACQGHGQAVNALPEARTVLATLLAMERSAEHGRLVAL